ncbi:MAG: hypothetical protein ACO3RT_11020 [Arenicellales bacterium]
MIQINVDDLPEYASRHHDPPTHVAKPELVSIGTAIRANVVIGTENIGIPGERVIDPFARDD